MIREEKCIFLHWNTLSNTLAEGPIWRVGEICVPLSLVCHVIVCSSIDDVIHLKLFTRHYWILMKALGFLWIRLKQSFSQLYLFLSWKIWLADLSWRTYLSNFTRVMVVILALLLYKEQNITGPLFSRLKSHISKTIWD